MVQYSHYAVVYDVDEVLLLVEIRSVTIVQGIIIKYESVIKSLHKRFLKIACDRGLKWACEYASEAPANLGYFLKAVISA